MRTPHEGRCYASRSPKDTDHVRRVIVEESVRALIFGWGGTLADMTSANFQSLREGLGERRHVMSRMWFDRRTGLSTEAMLEVLAEE